VLLPSSERVAIAIDLGTTTIAAALITLPGGEILARIGSLNPQRVHGLDVVSRLEYATRSPENLKELQNLVNRELSRIAGELLAAAGLDAGAVEIVAIAGNPTMSHLLLGLPVESIAHPPYRPRITGAHRIDAQELGWSVSAPVYVFPSPGGFVGGDTVAFLYGLGFPDPRSPIPDPALFLDLGTNGEIALLSGGKLFATSAAAGPAFEGGNLSCGMAALPGAIFSVRQNEGRLVTASIADASPVGLCGSGVIDAVTLLLEEGLLDETGRILDPSEISSPLGSRIQEKGGERQFLIYRDAGSSVSLTQGDIRQIQLAKGAVRAGMEVLLDRAGITGDSLQEVVLTGSFGAALSFESLKTIGVLTQNMVKTSRFVREGALSGVIRSLISPDPGPLIESLSSSLRIIPLSGTPLFEQYFMAHINFAS
jgi:uncharacterized 2Fe-2S/4Fe-4S cluster protein (DUF4445 family)